MKKTLLSLFLVLFFNFSYAQTYPSITFKVRLDSVWSAAYDPQLIGIPIPGQTPRVNKTEHTWKFQTKIDDTGWFGLNECWGVDNTRTKEWFSHLYNFSAGQDSPNQDSPNRILRTYYVGNLNRTFSLLFTGYNHDEYGRCSKNDSDNCGWTELDPIPINFSVMVPGGWTQIGSNGLQGGQWVICGDGIGTEYRARLSFFLSPRMVDGSKIFMGKSYEQEALAERNFCTDEVMYLRIDDNREGIIQNDDIEYVWEYNFNDNKVTAGGKCTDIQPRTPYDTGSPYGYDYCLPDNVDPRYYYCSNCEPVYELTWNHAGSSNGFVFPFSLKGRKSGSYKFRVKIRNKKTGAEGPWSDVPTVAGKLYEEGPEFVSPDKGNRYVTSATDTMEKSINIEINHISCKSLNELEPAKDGEIIIKNLTGTGPFYYNLRRIKEGKDCNDTEPIGTGNISGQGKPRPGENNPASWIRFSGLKAGKYCLRIENIVSPTTSTDGGTTWRMCYHDEIITIKEPASYIIASVDRKIYNKYHVSWKYASDGEVIIKGEGGIAPYTYFLRKGDGKFDDQAQGVFSNLPAYDMTNNIQLTYYYYVQDALGCTTPMDSFQLDAPELMEITGVGFNKYPDEETGPYTIQCQKGTDTAYVSVIGGVQPYFVYRNEVLIENFMVSDSSENSKDSVTLVVPGLRDGDNKLVIIDKNLKEFGTYKDYFEDTVLTLIEPSVFHVANQRIVPPTCNQFVNGELYIKAAGGIPFETKEGDVYNFELVYTQGKDFSRPEFDPNPEGTLVGGDSIYYKGLVAGEYLLTISGKYGCEVVNTIFIDEPKKLETSPKVLRHVSCYEGTADGKASIAITGGTSPYRFSLLNSEKDTLELYKNVRATEGETVELINLPADIYTVVVKDTNNCGLGSVHSFEIQRPNQPLQLYANIEKISCKGANNGSVTLEAIGGWENGTQLFGTDLSNLQLNNTKFNNLGPGSYIFYVKDALGCTDEVSVTLTDPEAVSIKLEKTAMVSCNGDNSGGFEMSIMGGYPPYMVTLDNGLTWTALSGADVFSWSRNNLSAGKYHLIGKDANGCTSNTISLVITEPPLLQEVKATRVVTKSTCGNSDGAISFTFSGGTSPYTINWEKGGEVLEHYDQNQAGTISLPDLAAGTYLLTITDAKGCTVNPQQPAIPIGLSDEEGPLADSISSTPVSCYGRSNGEAEISVEGGKGAVKVVWSDGQEGKKAVGLKSGAYVATVTDENECVTTVSFTIKEPKPLAIHFEDYQHPMCNGASNGYIKPLVTGGNGGNRFYWSTGDNTASLQDLGAGEYILTVIDAKECIVTDTLVLNDPEKIEPALPDETVQLCYGQSYTLDSGYPGCTYEWRSDFGFTSENQAITINQAGKYTVNVTDQTGCQGSKSVEVVYSNNVLNAEFLLSSSARVGDTVVVVNISNPKPEKSSLEYEGNISLHRSEDVYEELIFNEAGIYTINLMVQLAQCQDFLSKEIVIYEAGEEIQAPGTGSLIRELKIYPNPNSGVFKAAVTLREAAAVSLELLDLELKNSLLTHTGTGKAVYEFDFSLINRKSGVYILYLKAGEETRTSRIVIQ